MVIFNNCIGYYNYHSRRYSVLEYETCSYPDSKVHGANMGPTWVLSAPDGPHVGPMSLAIRLHIATISSLIILLYTFLFNIYQICHICIGSTLNCLYSFQRIYRYIMIDRRAIKLNKPWWSDVPAAQYLHILISRGRIVSTSVVLMQFQCKLMMIYQIHFMFSIENMFMFSVENINCIWDIIIIYRSKPGHGWQSCIPNFRVIELAANIYFTNTHLCS